MGLLMAWSDASFFSCKYFQLFLCLQPVHLIKFKVLICIELSQSELNISVRLGIWDEDHDSVAILAQDT